MLLQPLIHLFILCLVLGLAYWILQLIPLPPPIKQVVLVIFVVIAVIFLIYFLLGLTPHHVAW